MPKVEFAIRSGVGKSVDVARLQQALQRLGSFFGGDLTRVVSTSIEQPPQAEFLIRLASKLEEVSAAPEFLRHLRSYMEGIEPAFFVTCLAAYLQSGGYTIEFDPRTRNRRRADVAAEVDGLRTVFECKSPVGPSRDSSPTHQRIFNVLHPFIDTPHTVTLRFRRPMSADDLNALGKSIQRRLPSVREDGVFLSHDGVEVAVDSTMSPAVHGIALELSVTAPDPEDNTLLPGLIVMRGGRKMAIFGPKVDASGVLVGRLRKASKQAPLDSPFVAAISASSLLGAPREHRLAVLEQFQPNKFTRISGVLIADFQVTVNGRENPKIRFIANPYSVRPVPGPMRTMLGES